MLRKLGLQKNPAVVILNIYEGNDLRDALPARFLDSSAHRSRTDESGLQEFT